MGIFASIPVALLYSSFLLTSSLTVLGESATRISVEEEWISTMYPTQRHHPLQNYFLKARLISQVVSPLLIAPFFYLDVSWAILIICLILWILIIPEYLCLHSIYHKRVELKEGRDDSQWIARDLYPDNPITNIVKSWRRLKSQVLFLIIITNMLMSFWYLSLDMTIFISYLSLKSVQPIWIGVFRSSVGIVSLVCILFIYLFFY